MPPTIYAYGFYIIPADFNLVPYLKEDSDELAYIHAFADTHDDGEGLHLTDEGAILQVRPYQNDQTKSVLLLAMPCPEWATLFSPSDLGSIEPAGYGKGTMEAITAEIESA